MKRFKLCVAAAFLALTASVVYAEEGDDLILTAREAASRGDTARLQMLRGQTNSHVLSAYVSYWLYSAQIARKTQPMPTDDLRAFLRQNEGSVLAERLRSDWLKRLAKEGSFDLFNSEYARLQQPDQELQCDAILSRNELSSLALKSLSDQWLTLIDPPEPCLAPMQMLVSTGSVKTNDVWARFRRQVEAKRFTGAATTARWLSSSDLPDQAALSRALNEPARYLNSASDTEQRAGRELIIAAITRLARSDSSTAYARWRSLDTNAFTPAEQSYVMGQLAWMASLSQKPEALAWFSEVKDDTQMSDEQIAWWVRSALRAGSWSGVRTAISNMTPEQQAQPDWVYWAGRAMMAQGNSTGAVLMFQKIANEPTFYGILATEALGRHFAWPATAPAVTREELRQAQSNSSLQRSVALYRLNMRTEAMREWNWGIRNADDRTLLAASEFARQQNIYDRAINTADRTKQQHDYNLRYLAPYYETFFVEAKNNALDLPWVYGLTRQESRFVYDIRSGAGAQGLMQVMPATGKWIANKSGYKDYQPNWLTQVDTNVKLGTAYLRNVLNELSDSPTMASAAYNAGPGRAKRWRAKTQMEGAIYAETIPITETRIYVKTVMANATIYATLFNNKATSLTHRLGVISPVN